jgi:hypothetical protein
MNISKIRKELPLATDILTSVEKSCAVEETNNCLLTDHVLFVCSSALEKIDEMH